MLAPRVTVPDRLTLWDESAPHPTVADRTITWEETPCPLCGREDAGPVTEAADPLPAVAPGLRFAVVQCRHCSLRYTNPRPTPDTIAPFYPPGYSPHEAKTDAVERPVPPRVWSWAFGHPCPERRGRLPFPRPGRLLDFGCGGGSYLKRMAGLGWQVTGLDFSPEAIRTVREKLGCEAVLGTLPHPDLSPGTFDAVTLWHALEHVHQPLAVLREAFRLLVPGGCVVVAVPNFDSMTRDLFGEHWFGLNLPRHLTHFTPETLRASLHAAGFEVTSLRSLSHPGWVRASARRAIEVGEGGLKAALLRRRSAARWAAWAGYLIGRADSIVAVGRRPE